MTTQTKQIVDDNDRIYQGLGYLHRQEHLGDDCMCTSEIAGVYGIVLDEINHLINSEVLSVLEELESKYGEFSDDTLGERKNYKAVALNDIESIKNRYKGA